MLFVVAVASVMLACNTNQNYTVTGTAEDSTEGNMLVLTPNNNGAYDTLHQVAISEGTFSFQGKIEKPTLISLVIEGKRGSFNLFLEGGHDLVVTWGKGEQKVTGGGAEQTMFSQLAQIKQDGSREMQPLQAEYFKAYNDKNQAAVDSLRALGNVISAKIQEKVNQLLQQHPDLMASAYEIAMSMSQLPLDDLKAKFDLLGEKAKATLFGERIKNRIEIQESVAIGKVAPNFTLDTPEGGTLTLHDVSGKLKLIDFWASWCGPCRAENPNVVALYKEYHPKGLEIIGVSLDNNDKNAWLKAISDDNLTWLHGSDLKGWAAAPAKLYGVNAIPHTVLLDENNVIIAKNLRGDALKAKVAELLK